MWELICEEKHSCGQRLPCAAAHARPHRRPKVLPLPNVNMRSGPKYILSGCNGHSVGEIGGNSRLLSESPWCDVSFYGGGMGAGDTCMPPIRSRRVYVEPEYYRPLGIPTVVFQFDSYWIELPRPGFYRHRDRWRHDRDWIASVNATGGMGSPPGAGTPRLGAGRERERREWESEARP